MNRWRLLAYTADLEMISCKIWEYLLWSCLSEFLPVYVQCWMCQKEGTNVDVISLEDALWLKFIFWLHLALKNALLEKVLSYFIPKEHCRRLHCPYGPSWLLNPCFDLPLVLPCWFEFRRVSALFCQHHASGNGNKQLRLSTCIATA